MYTGLQKFKIIIDHMKNNISINLHCKILSSKMRLSVCKIKKVLYSLKGFGNVYSKAFGEHRTALPIAFFKEKKNIKRVIAMSVTVVLLATQFSGCGSVKEPANNAVSNSALIDREAETGQSDSYKTYLLNCGNTETGGSDSIELLVADAQKNGAVFHWELNSASEGLYYIQVRYLPQPLNDESGTLVSFRLNGETPYHELNSVMLPDEYRDIFPIIQDKFGNDLRPDQEAADRVTENYLFDSALTYTQPLGVFLKTDSSVFEMEIISGAAQIKAVILKPADAVKSYEQVKKEYEEKGYSEIKGDLKLYQGEEAAYKSSTMLYPVSDRSSAITYPRSDGLVKLNSIGGTQWKTPGDYIAWTVDAPEEGLYKIHMRAKQNSSVGSSSFRAIYINGELPFKEAQNIAVAYDSNWQTVTLGHDGEDFLFYLKKGENEIRMVATLGEMDTVIRLTQNTADALNDIYRRFLIIMGAEPDLLRDYRLGILCPDEIADLRVHAETLSLCADWLEANSGSGNTTVALMRTLVRQMLTMNKDPDCIPSEFSYFKTNIGSLSSQCSAMKQQPLLIDVIGVGGSIVNMPAASEGFFSKLKFSINKLLYSFSADYQNMGDLGNNEENTKPITVWIGGGREQAQIVRNMTANSFTANTGILVRVQLVQASLISAAVAGVGPDAVINSTPDVFNFAMRNAAVPLSDFTDYSEIKTRFNDSLSIPFTYLGKVYALPETISFPVLYYRTDIFEELGVEVPQTWDDVIALSYTLSKNNMEFGIPTDPGNMTTSNTSVLNLVGMYMSIYKQRGLQIYANNGEYCLLDGVDSIDAFRFFTNLYTNYGFPLSYNFMNRFRTGEMPIGISGLSFYNEIAVSAPEIDGLWDIAQIPGTCKADGTVDHTAISSASGSMILASSDRREDAWEFLKWWTSAEIQQEFAREIEGLLGPSGRYSSANLEAFKNSSWPQKSKAVFSRQMSHLTAVENVPGSYFLSRNITNAFRAVVYKDVDPTDALYDYTDKINRELTQKRKEFGLE